MLGIRPLLRRGKSLARTFTSNSPKPYVVPENAWGRNRAARLELAAAYRALDTLGLNEGVCNHLSVVAPTADGRGEGMLVLPFGMHWSEVTASNLVSVECKDGQCSLLEGETMPEITASSIHLGIRQIRPNATVIMHTHQPYATSLACMKRPEILMVHQNSLRFYKRIAYDDNYGGLALAFEEGRRLGTVLGDSDVLFMGNHGVITVASTISVAFDLLYFLERASQVQVLTEAMKKEVQLIPDDKCQAMSDDFWNSMQLYADANFYASYRKLRRTQPDFEI
ncbi:putative aldolase class 2 protein RP493 [Palaemon carinicauda]|uniref:putative aldolase class 2 protein RP493 n=1 Tax=Palaemon carinicauda TaxID=392227 RepID=UPI0035B58532